MREYSRVKMASDRSTAAESSLCHPRLCGVVTEVAFRLPGAQEANELDCNLLSSLKPYNITRVSKERKKERNAKRKCLKKKETRRRELKKNHSENCRTRE